ncbi:sulfurtransferase [Nakamurella leprariae]|uniref:Sulfurtransferase n=1 Tax=Nakamurella leprariae TaxID=2803911 RepID=A0A939BXG0_9ACTN|nr:rhodanese-like domain-containing protein [Nakamurella leprariae]MBM9468518.1 sulfurtransferase [Nakamurella leprariae]
MGSHLVDVAWLAEHAGEVIVLDASITRTVDPDGRPVFADGLAGFEARHIPGARFADLVEDFSDPAAPFNFTRPTAAQFERAARAVGVRPDSTVIAYDSLTGAWAARLWWVFRSFGFDGIQVLDGGLAAWEAAGQPTATGPSPTPAPGTLVAAPRSGWFVDTDAVLPLAQQPDPEHPVVCALRREEYLGEGGAAGHIPGSRSLPYPDVLRPDGTLSVPAVRAAAESLGLDRAQGVTLYCGGGINAAGLALALTEAGYDGLTVYDGSLGEWRADPSRPLATGSADGSLALGLRPESR